MSTGKRKKKNREKGDFVDRAIRYFQAAVTDWPLYMLHGLIMGALGSLRHHMESEDAPDVSWRNPFAELQIPVRWNWETNQVIFIDDLDPQQARKREDEYADSIFDYHIAQVLWVVTNGAVLYKEGSDVYPILEQEVWDVINSLSDADAMGKLDELYRPFCIGCTLPKQDGRPDDDGTRSDDTALHRTMEDIPELTFACPVGDGIVSGTMMFVFQPLKVDADEHRAYYPILTGLVFDDPDAVLLLSPSEQGEFWGRLLQWLDGICDSLPPDIPDEGRKLRSVLLEGIESTIFSMYRPWIVGVHESALASLRERGELPALKWPDCGISHEPKQLDSGTAAEEEGTKKAKPRPPFQSTQIETRQGVTYGPERLLIVENGFFAIHEKDGEERKFRFRRKTKKFEALRYMAVEALNGNRFPDKYDVATMCNIALDEYNPRDRSLRSWFVSGGGDPERFAKRFMKSDRKGGCEILVDPELIEILAYRDYSDDEEEQGE